MSIEIIPPVATAGPVALTGAAVAKASEFMEATGGFLRLGVRGGGCSGFQYQLAIDEMGDGDIQWDQDGIELICDRASLAYLTGAVLDYRETFEESGFHFENPNATAACGCGSSFRIDDQDGCDSVAPEDIYGAESAV